MPTRPFALGRARPLADAGEAQPFHLPAHHLVTHGVVVGMTGSGKTGLSMVLVEEALRSGVPVLMIDVKGDLPNLLLTFPELAGSDFAPWLDPQAARRAGRTVEEAAHELAQGWRDRLAEWNLGPGDVADLLTLKAFCSRTVDRVRPPYGRSSIDVPRRCVFIGTTNEGGYLTDPTGNRRFWPLEVIAEVDVEALRRDRDQLWAEASALEAQGVSIVLDQGLWSLAAERQAEETTEDPWADLVRQFIEGLRSSEAAWMAGEEEAPPVPAADRVHTLSLFEEALDLSKAQRTGAAAQRLKAVMTEALGWSHRRGVRVGDKTAAGFVRWPEDKGPMPEGAKAPY